MEKKQNYDDFQSNDLMENGVCVNSMTRINNSFLFVKKNLGKYYFVCSGEIKKKFTGRSYDVDGSKYLTTLVNKDTLNILRTIVPYTSTTNVLNNQLVVEIPAYYGKMGKGFFDVIDKYSCNVMLSIVNQGKYVETPQLDDLIDQMTFNSFINGYSSGYDIKEKGYIQKEISLVSWEDIETSPETLVTEELEEEINRFINKKFYVGGKNYTFSKEDILKLNHVYANVIDDLAYENIDLLVISKAGNGQFIKDKLYLLYELKYFKTKIRFIKDNSKNEVNLNNDLDILHLINDNEMKIRLVLDINRLMNLTLVHYKENALFILSNLEIFPVIYLVNKYDKGLMRTILQEIYHLNKIPELEGLNDMSDKEINKLIKNELVQKTIYDNSLKTIKIENEVQIKQLIYDKLEEYQLLLLKELNDSIKNIYQIIR